MSKSSNEVKDGYFFYSLLIAFFLFTVYCSLFTVVAAQEAGVLPPKAIARVIITPFSIHGKDDLSGFRRKILNALASAIESDRKTEVVGIERLKRLVLDEKVYLFDEAIALKIGKDEDASFAILGSITKIDKAISLDVRLLDISSGKIIASLYLKKENEKTMLESAASLAADIQTRIQAEGLRPKKGDAREIPSAIINKIIITGNKRVDEDAVKAKLKSKAGELVSSDDLRDDIKAVYDMGFFEDVMADVATRDKGTYLNFIVKEKPVIKKVVIAGNKEIKDEKINGVITVKENTILNRTLLFENAEKIKALYATEGFYLAKVEPVIERKDDATAAVNFKIEEGDKVKVKRITIIGNKAFKESKIKDIMDTSEVGFFSFMTKAGVFDEAVFQNDLNKIMAHYYDNGYMHASITDHLVSLSSDKKWFFITIALVEGEQYRVGKIDIKGDVITATKSELMEKVKTTTGDIFSRKILTEDISRLNDVYGDEGYANVNINPVTGVDEKEKRADITFDIQKGELVYIEKINISGNVNTRDKVIRREIELSEGELFSATDMKRSRNNLNRLGYFEKVNIAPQPGSSENKVVLNVDVKERPTGSISAGIGYSSVDKIIGTASISQSNFRGTGLKLDLSGTLSSKSERYQLGITEPWLFDKPISAGVDLFKIGRQYPDFTRDSYGFDVRTGFPVYKRDVRGYLTYKLEDVTVKDVASGAAQLIKDQEGKKTTSSINAVLKRDTRDDAFFPTEGSVTSLSVEFAGGLLGGDNNFITYVAEGVKYFPLFWDTTFVTHGVIGYVQGFGGKDIPVYERFYLGGINTIRGFRTRTIGPRDPATNDIIGGDKEVFANFEYLFPLVTEQKVRGLIFYDAGNAYNGDIDLGDLRTSAGIGIRWFSPVGPLRLEWGRNLNRREGEKASQWEFTIGTVF
ncbi:MAG: outer membrane protein assembly factor BamA [Deltaproteobacteria bacterium]|nr:outer membrane protein assembly factor BamA [Deltaproteobacteria bacterium]